VLKEASEYNEGLEKEQQEKEYQKKSLLEKAGMEYAEEKKDKK